MKVLVVGHSLSGGGAEFVTREWIRYLHDAGEEIVVALLDRGATPALDLDAGIEQTVVADHGVAHWQRVRSLRRLIRRSRADVCLAMQTYPALLTLFATRGMADRPRVVLSERNMPSLLLRTEGLAKKTQYALARKLYRRAEGVIAISHPVAADLVSALGVLPRRCFVVPNPASAKTRQVIASPSSSVSTAPLVLTLPFRLAPQKRPTIALDTARVLQERGYDVHLHFFGRGPLEEQVRAEAVRNGLVTKFFGWREEWFAAASPGSVVLLPSHCEGFGNVLVEAAAAGIPSVAWSGALGVADAIIPGVTGEFALVDSPAGFADAIEAASKLHVAAPPGWIAHFSPQESGSLLRQVLSHVLEDAPATHA